MPLSGLMPTGELCHRPSQGKREGSSSQRESGVLPWIQASRGSGGPFSSSPPGLPRPDSGLTLPCHPASPSAADPELWPCHVLAGRFVFAHTQELWQLNDRIIDAWFCACEFFVGFVFGGFFVVLFFFF